MTDFQTTGPVARRFATCTRCGLESDLGEQMMPEGWGALWIGELTDQHHRGGAHGVLCARCLELATVFAGGALLEGEAAGAAGSSPTPSSSSVIPPGYAPPGEA